MTGFGTFRHTINTSAHIDAAQARGSASKATQKVAYLESRLNRALLACEALWTIVRDHLDITDDELIERINEIDLSDGKLDGKAKRPAVECPACHRKFARRFTKCIYCSHPVRPDPFA